MAGQDDLELWLGRIGSDRRVSHRVLKSTNLSGGIRRGGLSARSGFDGSRIGRGSGVGRVLGSSGRFAGRTSRQVVVKGRIVKLAGKGLKGAAAHLRYLQRDGTTREGERGSLYSSEQDVASGREFLDRGAGDRHQFRFIVAAEDGAEYDDLKPLVRRLMAQAEQDLGTKLDWVAVDHFNTGHPHSHILVRGKDDRGKDLIIAREYMSRGFRARATELVNLDLGPRTEREIMRAQLREVEQERFTGIDRRLIAAIDAEGFVSPHHPSAVEQALRTGRLQRLAAMDLAVEERRGRWRLDPQLEASLRRMGERGDIIKTLHREMKARAPHRAPSEYAIFDPAEGKGAPIIGRVIARGLADELFDRQYLVVDGIDGRSHYVDLGSALPDPTIANDAIVCVTPRAAAVREVDRTIAEIAARNGGRYSVDDHLRHDPSATERFAEAHVRRLEAIRRGSRAVEREPDGTWVIAPDHLERVEQYEREQVRRDPVRVELLSGIRLEQLPAHDGATWLDQQLVEEEPAKLGRGFGADVREALDRRRQWLIERQLAEQEGDVIRYRGNMAAILQQRELRRVAVQLSSELGLAYVETHRNGQVEGTYRRSVQVGAQRFAVIEKSKEFTLVPWKPVLERTIGKQVSGIMRGDSVSWTIGRSRGIEIG